MTGSPLVDGNGVTLKACSAPGCLNRAVVFPELVIPPRGYPHSKGLRVNIALPLCRKHGLAEKAENFLTDELREMASATVSLSPIPLDFNRAKINLKPIGGVEWNKAADAAREARAGRERH